MIAVKRLFVLGLAALAAAGAIRPALAQVDFLTDLLMSEAQEKRIAEQEHPKILAQFGGAYEDEELSHYVQSLADFLGRASRRPDIAYRVTILNSPVVNAFALPAGYLYVTRGLLALADSEAELAGVLAHEIGHVTARHTAQRFSRTLLAQGLVGLLGAATKGTNLEGLAQAATPAALVALQGFSREHEHEADLLGVETLSRAGFDPMALSSFLAKLERQTDLDARLAGRDGPPPFTLFATHPRTAERVQRTVAQAASRVVREPMVARNLYLEKIDGMLYGDDPAQGFVRGRVFAHKDLDVRFEVPEGFALLNGQKAVTAQGKRGEVIRFDLAPDGHALPPDRYLTEVWARERPLQGLERIEIDGYPAATAAARLEERSGPVDVRLVAIKTAPERIYRFLFAARAPAPDAFGEAARETAFSFRRLTGAETRDLKPRRLVMRPLRKGESVSDLADSLPFPVLREDRFRVLNGLGASDLPAPGRMVKLIVED